MTQLNLKINSTNDLTQITIPLNFRLNAIYDST